VTFAHPGWLLAGGLASLAILFLHLFRPRRRTVRVSSLLLWRDIQREVALNKRRKRIFTTILLLLQILFVLLLAFALARPSTGDVPRGYEVAIVVDTSASMGLFEPGGTRFTLARTQIQRYLAEGEADRYSLWSAGNGALLYAGTSKHQLVAALDRLPGPAGVSDWDTTFARLSSLHSGAGHLHTVIATDGAIPAQSLSGIASLGSEVAVIRVGTPHGNVGIIGFSARPVGEDPFLHEVLVTVSNMSGQVQQATLVIESDRPPLVGAGDRQTIVLSERALTIPPNESERLVFERRFRSNEVLTARLDISDLFPADNQATLVASPQDAMRALFVGGAGYLLRQGFEVFGQVQISEALNLPPPDVAAYFDVMIFYDRPVPADFKGDAIVFHSGINAPSDAPQPEVSWWNKAHPLSRFVAWDEINIGPAEPLALAPGESVLVETTLGPIVTVRSEPERRIVRVAIPLERSDFPFRISYPIFLHNLIEWVNPQAASLVPTPMRPGTLPSQAAIALEQGDGRLRVHAFGDQTQWIEVDRADAMEVWTFLSRPGAYIWEANGRTGTFAVSLLDSEESDLTPRLGEWAAQGSVRLRSVGSERLADVERRYEGDRESTVGERDGLGPWGIGAALLALIVLAAEGYIFARTHGPTRPVATSGALSGAAATGRASGPKGA